MQHLTVVTYEANMAIARWVSQIGCVMFPSVDGFCCLSTHLMVGVDASLRSPKCLLLGGPDLVARPEGRYD